MVVVLLGSCTFGSRATGNSCTFGVSWVFIIRGGHILKLSM